MIKKFLFFQIWISIILFANAAWGADKISGNACYTYGDNESLVQAEQMTKTLAIRNAVESYSLFVESTTQVTDFQLSVDLINTVSTGQVKAVKILKRLESGRKLCYTIEGFVEPQDLKIAIKDYLKDKQKSTNVRLQENEWIKIVSSFVEEITPEKFYKGDKDMLAIHKTVVKSGDSRENFRKLYVKLQFLKPCIAKTLDYMSDAKQLKTGRFLPKEADLQFGLVILHVLYEGVKEGKIDKKEYEKTVLEFDKVYSDYGIDPVQFRNDVLLPAYRCDYRIKAFATFFSSPGYELETKGEIPFALLINDTVRKTEILPGEDTYVSFLIPDKAESWEVWVPK
jgi:hypothetical protein